MHLSQKKLQYFAGNYDSFVNTLSDKQEEQEKRYKSEQDQINHMKEYVARFGQGNAKMAKQAQSKEKTLEKMMRWPHGQGAQGEGLDFRFNDCGKLSSVLQYGHQLRLPGLRDPLLRSRLWGGSGFSRGSGGSERCRQVHPAEDHDGELMPVHGDVRPLPSAHQ